MLLLGFAGEERAVPEGDRMADVGDVVELEAASGIGGSRGAPSRLERRGEPHPLRIGDLPAHLR